MKMDFLVPKQEEEMMVGSFFSWKRILTRNVEQKSFVVVLHELYNTSCLFAKVFQTDDPHDIWSIFCIWSFAKLVSNNQTSCCLICSNSLQIQNVEHGAPEKIINQVSVPSVKLKTGSKVSSTIFKTICKPLGLTKLLKKPWKVELSSSFERLGLIKLLSKGSNGRLYNWIAS